MKKIAVISAILEHPDLVQTEFNNVVSEFKSIVSGRMGLPFSELGVSSVSIVVCGEMDEINRFTGKLGQIEHVTAKTVVSKKDF